MRFTEIISENVSPRLKDIAKIATNMPDADFWLVRKGSDKTVGKPVKEFDPSRIGVKVVKTDVLDPNYLYYAMMNLHNQGHFARIANGTTNLVNITVNDIANIPLGQQDVSEDWNKANRKDKTSGMSRKAVKAYRRENPGSKLQTAVTTKPSKLKPGSKAAKRRKSFCARMSGNKGPMKKPNGKPTPKALALRRWNCESVEQMEELVMLAEQYISNLKK